MTAGALPPTKPEPTPTAAAPRAVALTSTPTPSAAPTPTLAPPSLALRPMSRTRATLAVTLFMLLAVAPIWLSLNDHPLYGGSESRYAIASRTMYAGGDWLVPHRHDQPHVTKPPLTYWLQATSMKIFGPTEFAARVPSALAGTGVLVGVLLLGRRIANWRVGLAAAATLAVMPSHVSLSRITLTDGLLSFFWFGTLAAGYMAATEPPKRWPARSWRALLWLALALGLFTKGPVALLPLGVLLTWLGLAGRRHDIKRLRPVIGLTLASLPLLLWAIAVLYFQPEAANVWYAETIGRVVGTGDHPEPIWFFVPILLLGMFPASAMLTLPGINYPWQRAWPKLRGGSAGAMLALAVLIPFTFFSLSRGKLPSYLLPVAAPLALLTGLMLERWLTGLADRHPQGEKPPAVSEAAAAIGVGAALAAPIVVGLMVGWRYAWIGLALLPVTAATLYMWRVWYRRPHLRARALLLTWVLLIFTWLFAAEAEDALRVPRAVPAMLEAFRTELGVASPRVMTVGFSNDAMSFYLGYNVARVTGSLRSAEQLAANYHADQIIVAERPEWERFCRVRPQLRDAYVPAMEWVEKPGTKPLLVLRPRTP